MEEMWVVTKKDKYLDVDGRWAKNVYKARLWIGKSGARKAAKALGMMGVEIAPVTVTIKL